MTGPVAALLPGNRLHLQHGPIDLVIGAEDDSRSAFVAAQKRFATLLEELVEELTLLRQPVGERPIGDVAQRMHAAVLPHDDGIVTPMAAVAGAVAEEVLAAMTRAARLRRAYVNNGGDIALHLDGSEQYSLAISPLSGAELGRVTIHADDGARGIASSGFGGRSLSFGIADTVTVIAPMAAQADVAATLIANAVDLSGHPAILRKRACDLQPDSDLGEHQIVSHVGYLTPAEIEQALDNGEKAAAAMLHRGQIAGAALFLRGDHRLLGLAQRHEQERVKLYA